MTVKEPLGKIALIDVNTGKSVDWNGIKTITEEDLKPERPYRTYIQMYVYGDDKAYSTLAYFGYKYLAVECCRYLENHPEKIEEVVKERVRIGKFIKGHHKMHEWEWLFTEMQIVNTWRRNEMMKAARGGATVRVGSTSLLGLSSSVSVYDELLYREKLETKKEPQPGYVPKHIQHRKKGRK